jgi:hypothetical protein
MFGVHNLSCTLDTHLNCLSWPYHSVIDKKLILLNLIIETNLNNRGYLKYPLNQIVIF